MIKAKGTVTKGAIAKENKEKATREKTNTIKKDRVKVVSWQEVKTEVVSRIRNRFWLQGEMLPKEADLAEEFGCTRTTVNRALRDIADSGLVNRRRKAGTRVALNPTRRATLHIPIIRLEIENRGDCYTHKVVRKRLLIPPVSIRDRLLTGARVKLVHLTAVHLANDEPFMYEDRWINTKTVPAATNEDFQRMNANEWLVQNTPFTHGEIAFTAANATATVATHIGANKGEAIFVMERTTWSDTDSITTVRMSYAPGHRMDMRI